MKFVNKDSLWIMFSNVIKMIFGFLVVPIIARYVAPEQLGKLDLLLAFGPIVNQFISMGFLNSSSKFYKENNDDSVIRYMQGKIWMRSGIMVALFFMLFSIFGSAKLNIPLLIAGLYSFSLFLENITFLPQNQFLNTDQFKKYSIITTLGTVIRYLFTLILVILMKDKLLALSVGLLISNIYLVLVTFRHHDGLLFTIRTHKIIAADFELVIRKYSYPLFYLGTVGILYQSSDRLLLAYFSHNDMAQIGYLGIAQRIVGIVSVALSGLFTVWGVKAFENYSDGILMKEKEKLIGMMLVVMLVSAVSMFLLKPLIVQYVLTSSYYNAFPICVLLIATFVNNRIREILEKFFLKKGKSKLISRLYIGFGVFSVLSSALILYLYSLVEMLMFRLLIAFLHSLILYYLLYKENQKINALLLILNFLLSIGVVIAVGYGLF